MDDQEPASAGVEMLMTGRNKVTALKPRGSQADGFDAGASRRRRMTFNAGDVIALLAFALMVVALF